MADRYLLLFDTYRLDLRSQRLWRGDHPGPLPNKAFAVLRYFVEHSADLVTKEALLHAVWPGTSVTDNVLTNCIGEVRQALGDHPRRPRFIETVHRRGYRFLPTVTIQTIAEPQGALQDNALPGMDNQKPEQLLVGRRTELAQLHHLFAKAANGQRQVVFVTGEAGIGKTVLVETFVQSLRHNPEICLGYGQCIEQYGAGEAYLPLLEALERLGRAPGGERLVALLAQYAPSWLVQLPGLLTAGALADLQRTLAGATRERMLRELGVALDIVSAEHPLVLVLEDLHWSDSSTVEALAMLARRRDRARLLVVGTYRVIEMVLHDHPLKTVKHELMASGQGVEIALPYLNQDAVHTYVATRVEDQETVTVLAPIVYRRTDGHPLFMVQVTDYLEQAGEPLVTTATALIALEQVLPQGLRELIEAQIGRLTAEEQHVLEVGSVAGVVCAVASIAAGLQLSDSSIETVCERLARRGQFLDERGIEAWPDGTISGRYGFRHALYHEILYARLPQARRVRLHQAIGTRIESGYGERTQEMASELAMHFTHGRDFYRAVSYLQTAADNALRRYAFAEAIGLLTQALALLQEWPDTPARVQQELTLHVALGAPLLLTKGQASPEVESTYNRARELCRQVGDTPQLSLVHLGLWRFYANRAQYQITNELAEQFLERAQSAQDAVRLAHAHAMQAQTAFLLGEFTQAKEHAEQGLAFYDPTQHRSQIALYGIDARIFCFSHLSHALWMLGYADQALQRSQEALAWGQELSHAFNLALAFERAATCHFLRREEQVVHELVEAGMALSCQHGFAAREAYGRMLRGWVLAQHDQCEAGIAHIREGVSAFQATGAELLRPYFLALLAEAYGKGGHPADGLQVVAEALTLVGKTGERVYEAELWRLAGELLLHAGAPAPWLLGDALKVALVSPAECFLKAIAVAQEQQAKSLELRASTSLAQLWQQQGKGAAACQLLSEIYAWFTEGFETQDMQEARTLLQELAAEARSI